MSPIPRDIRKLFQRLQIDESLAVRFEDEGVAVADLLHLTQRELERLLPPKRSRAALLDWVYGTLLPAQIQTTEHPWLTTSASAASASTK